jgi:hypothetical protein
MKMQGEMIDDLLSLWLISVDLQDSGVQSV